MKHIIFAQADKNLGPVAVTLEQYVRDALVHLSDSETYELLTESEARARDEELRLEIRRWLIKFSNSVELDVRNYIKTKLDETESDPLAIFTSSTKFTRALSRQDQSAQTAPPHLTL